MAHENGQTTRKRRCLTTPLKPCSGGHGPKKLRPCHKIMCYSPRKRRVLTTQRKTCTGGTGLETRPQTKKQCALAKKNIQKRQNRRVFASPLEPCTMDHGLENHPQTQKTVCYGSGKRPDNTKTTRFDDAPQIV